MPLHRLQHAKLLPKYAEYIYIYIYIYIYHKYAKLEKNVQKICTNLPQNM